ncbi:MAG: sigma 54-interacting transcriptional regulator [Vicinamibacterales bacterium]
MQLIADRFVVNASGAVFDLATGVPVLLRLARGGEPGEQMRWAARCSALEALHHRAVAPLLDYGACGRTERFEAWHCESAWAGAASEAERALDTAALFLRACHLTAGRADRSNVHALRGRAVVVPGAETGYDSEEPIPELPAGRALIDVCGVRRIDRPAVRALADVFESVSGPRSSVVQIWGRPGSGRTEVVLGLARIARRNGFVPVALDLLHLLDAPILNTRSFCLIDDAAAGDRWRMLLVTALHSQRAHVLLVTGQVEMRGVHGIGIDGVPPEILAAAMRPQPLPGAASEGVARAARMARGLPGKFVQQLWGPLLVADGRSTRRPVGFSRAAEQQAEYGGLRQNVQDARDIAEVRSWPAPGELAALRRRMDGAKRLVAQGRHAPGLRQLRQAVGGLARRDDWAHAAEGAIALSGALVGRGRSREAHEVLDDARRHAEHAGDTGALIDIAVLGSHAWIDLARLDEAESVASAALTGARGTGDGPRMAAASLALGRCLFWRGRYAEADGALNGPARGLLPPRTVVQLNSAVARVAVGVGDLARAVSAAREAADEAGRADDPGLVAMAACAAAFVHLAVNDFDAVEGDVGRCLAAARQARMPLRAIRARLIWAEAERRRGRRATARALITRLQRLGPSCLPATVRVRCDVIGEATSGSVSIEDALSRHRARTGFEALALYVPSASPQGGSPQLIDPIGEAVAEIMRICQSAEEETRLLTEVCARIRRELHAAAVAFVGVERASCAVVAADGPRPNAEMAHRVVASGLTIAPHLCDGRLEAGAPVRYGGATRGALVARWPLGTPHDLSRAPTLLTTAATAAAPAFSTTLLRRAQAPDPAMGDLLGVSTAMEDLRRAIRSAAQAPFAVLILGESGSGKELVARSLHRAGPRRDRPFCTLNCAALPDELVEAELFGHARGAFTGAVGERAGVFEEAHGGTLFLDEVGELSPRAQAKLLRVVQEGELRRIGENLPRRVDVRSVAATNRDLRTEVASGRFRLDLMYRLDVVRIEVPPLRQRREDIPVLVDHCWREATARIGSQATLSAPVIAALARYDWPGNVRELQNVLAALAVRSPRRGVIPVSALPPPLCGAMAAETWRLEQARRIFEERFVRAALARNGGRRARAAAELGVTRQGLTKLMARLGIRDDADNLLSADIGEKEP